MKRRKSDENEGALPTSVEASSVGWICGAVLWVTAHFQNAISAKAHDGAPKIQGVKAVQSLTFSGRGPFWTTEALNW